MGCTCINRGGDGGKGDSGPVAGTAHDRIMRSWQRNCRRTGARAHADFLRCSPVSISWRRRFSVHFDGFRLRRCRLTLSLLAPTMVSMAVSRLASAAFGVEGTRGGFCAGRNSPSAGRAPLKALSPAAVHLIPCCRLNVGTSAPSTTLGKRGRWSDSALPPAQAAATTFWTWTFVKMEEKKLWILPGIPTCCTPSWGQQKKKAQRIYRSRTQ